jgi:predicted Zn-dependent peptidase
MIRQTVLDNGLKVVTEAMPGRRIASVGFWSPAGSARERRAEAGISHLLEHMLFKGTPRRSAFGIAAALDAVGGDLNAFTDREHSCFHCTLLGDHLKIAIEVLSDMLFNSHCGEPALTTERAVVLEEIADYEDSPEEVVHDCALRLLWPTHPLGRPVHGSARAVMSIDRPALLAHRDRWYTPSALVVAAAGNLSHDHLVDLLLSHTPDGSAPRPRFHSRRPKAARGSRILQRDTEQAHLCLAVPASGWRDESRYVDAVLSSAIGAGPSSRLFQQIRERRGLAYNVGAVHVPSETTGTLALYAGTQPKKVGEVVALFGREIAKIRRAGLRRRELERVKGCLLATMQMSMDSPGLEGRRLGHSLLHRGRIIPPEHTMDRVARVAAEDVTRRANQLFAEGFWAAAFAGPLDGDDVPADSGGLRT